MKILTHFLLLAALLCFANTALQAQEEAETRYNAIDYMKVAPGMHADYLALEKAWKKIHQHNVKAGKILSWNLSAVVSPYGANTEYNYVTRITLKNAKQFANFLQDFPMPENLETILTADELKLVQRTSEIRTLVKGEVWSTVDVVFAENPPKNTVQVFNYFDFPEGKTSDDHVKMETDIWKPVHAARVKDGKMVGWVLARMEFPFGSQMPYQDATVDIYKDMEQYMTQGNPLPFFEKAHPGKDLSKLLEQTSAAADLLKGEVRVHIDGTE